MRRIPLTPLFAVAIATVSSTSHGDRAPLLENPLDQVKHQIAAIEGELTPLGQLGDLLGAAGDKVISTLDALRAHANVAAPDLSALVVEPVANSTTSGFGWREDPINKRRKFHSGADIRGKHGTPVMAAGAGTVICAESKNGYGNVIFIDHGNGLITRYAHLRKFEVKKGAVVTAGQRIGQVGSTGRTTGPHLHFEVRIDGSPVDPTTAMLVGELERESPAMGRLAAQVLAPELQRGRHSDLDPPSKTTTAKPNPRPERTNAPKRERKPLS
jgi:murein DD-endopeptidase MepM/ murein hydrolase activator NlpD